MSSKMLPDYPVVVIGITELQKRRIVPLSWKDTRELQGVFFYVFSNIVELEDPSPDEMFNFITSVIYENIFEIIRLVVKDFKDDPIPEEEFSLEQMSEIANHVFVMNFEGTIKNVQSLLQTAKVAMEKAKMKKKV